MSKWMKRISMLAVILCLVSMFFSMSAKASGITEGEDIYSVAVKVPEDWENPKVWAWSDDGKNVFDAWPGGEMEALPENEGWYYVWLPAWATHIIVNANEGEAQTGEQIVDGNPVWITMADPENTEIVYESQTEGEIPAYQAKFPVHIKVDGWSDPALWAWSEEGKNVFEAWPGKVLTDDGSGWHTINIPTWATNIIVNGNSGSIQTEDIIIDPAEIWVVVNGDGSYEFFYNNPDAEEVANITVHVLVPSDWEAPNLWAWSAPDGTNAFTAWPGEALEDNEGWMTKEVSGWVNSIIVNGSAGTVQTSDIAIDTGKDVWLVVTDKDTYEVFYEQPQITGNEQPEETRQPENEANKPDESEKKEEEAKDNSNKNSNTLKVLLPVVGGIVIVGGAAGLLLSRKKRK